MSEQPQRNPDVYLHNWKYAYDRLKRAEPASVEIVMVHPLSLRAARRPPGGAVPRSPGAAPDQGCSGPGGRA